MVRFKVKIYCKGDFFMQKQDESVEEVSEKTQVVEIIKEEPASKMEETSEKQEEKVFEKAEKHAKKDMKKMDNTPKKKWVKPVIISSIVVVFLLIFSMIFAIININSNKIISGVSINNIEVSGLTKEEAKGKLETIINEKKSKGIMLKYQDFETELSHELIETNYDLDEAVEQAYNIGRDSNLFGNNYNILFTLLGKKNIDINVNLNEEILEKTLKDASSNIPGAMKEASYYIEDENLIVTKGQKGITINFEEAKNKIKDVLKDINSKNNNFIEL
jgi:hypothetical protein